MSEHKNLAEALAAFQAELPHVAKSETANTGTYSYSYADLAGVTRVALPLLAKNGLSFSAKPTLDEGGRFILAYVLRHVGGDEDRGSYPLPNGSAQQVGSAITYARRYALMSVTGIAPDEDDDGRAAGGTEERWSEPAPVPTPEQVAKFDELLKLVNGAGDEQAITEHGKEVHKAKATGEITPMQYDQLARRASARLAEMKAS